MPIAGARHEEILFPVGPDNSRNSEASVIGLADGRLLLAWSDFYGGATDFSPARISAVTSRDRGRTWGGRYTLQENDSAMNVFGPSLLRLRSGALAHFYYHQEGEDDLKEYVRFSRDEAATWSAERCITPDAVRQCVNNDHAILHRSGRIVLPTYWIRTRSDPDHSYRSLSWYSDDDGETWRRGTGEVALPKKGAMEPVVVERRDGSLLMAIRTQLGQQYRAESFDRGETWTPARPMGLVSSESPAALRRIPATGDLLIVWNHTFDPARRHFGRSPLTAAISRDDGNTWENVHDLEDDPEHCTAYPTLFFQDDEVLLTYYRARDGTAGWELKIAILPVDWFYR